MIICRETFFFCKSPRFSWAFTNSTAFLINPDWTLMWFWSSRMPAPPHGFLYISWRAHAECVLSHHTHQTILVIFSTAILHLLYFIFALTEMSHIYSLVGLLGNCCWEVGIKINCSLEQITVLHSILVIWSLKWICKLICLGPLSHKEIFSLYPAANNNTFVSAAFI